MTDLFLVKFQLSSKLSPFLESFLDDVPFLSVFTDLLSQYSCTSRFAVVYGTHVISEDILRLVKASSGLSTLLSARDVLELKTPYPISKLVSFPARALKTSSCFSGFLRGTPVSFVKCHKTDKNNVKKWTLVEGCCCPRLREILKLP